jgi:DNA polymerase
MAHDADDLTAHELSRSLAAHLEHLQKFRGVQYVAASGMPGFAEQTPGEATEESAKVQAKESVADVKKRVLREQASNWTPGKKLAYLQDKNVGDCRRCALAQGRQNLVFGVGSADARLMFVGEAPGAEEDRRGEPFVGAAGKRLDSWIEALGMKRGDVYIANVLKCRPPGNRDPHAEEIDTCSPFLHAQIRAISPRVLVALGRFAGALLLGQQRRMYQMRGNVHEYIQAGSGLRIPLVVTYHPSYVLRSEQGPPRGPDNQGPRKSENESVLGDLTMAVKHLGDPR